VIVLIGAKRGVAALGVRLHHGTRPRRRGRSSPSCGWKSRSIPSVHCSRGSGS